MDTIYLVLFSFPKKQKWIYQSKNKTVCKAKRHDQSKIQTYCLNKRFNMSFHFTTQFNSYYMVYDGCTMETWLSLNDFEALQSKFIYMSAFRAELITGVK